MNASLKTSNSESTDSSENTSDAANQQQNSQQQGSIPGGQQSGTSNQQQQGTGQSPQGQPPAMSGSSQDGTSQNGTTGTGQQGMGQPPQGGMPGGGGGTFEVVDAAINVSGGNITVNAEGDGIDSNGVTTLSGGTLIVNGPSQGGNAALDTNGDLLLNGATVLSGSTADMFEAPSTNSTSGYLKLTNSSGFEQGSTVQVADSSGKVVANYKVTKSNVQLVLVSSSLIVKGQSYTVYTTTSAVDSNAASLASGATELGSFTAS